MDLDHVAVSVRHGPWSWAVLNVSSLLMNQEGTEVLKHGRRKRKFGVCARPTCVASSWFVNGCSVSGVDGQMRWREVTTQGQTQRSNYCSPRQAVFSLQIESKLNSQEHLHNALLWASDRKRSLLVLRAFLW